LSTTVSYIGKKVENITTEQSNEETVLPFFSIEQVRTFRSIFGFLNDKDRDILYLIFVSRKKQKDVQQIMNRSQPSLCYDIKRIRGRLKYIFYLHSVFDILMTFVEQQRECFTSEEMEILVLMFYTSSFTMTANILKLSQVRTRYSYNKCLRRMEKLEMWEPYEIFSVIRDNLNAVKRVYKGDINSLKTLSDL